MMAMPKQIVRALTLCAAVLLVAASHRALAQADHVLSSSALQQAAVDASQARTKNIDSLNRFFSSDQAQQALRSAHMDPVQIKSAVSGLSNDELAQLATRANKAQSDFAAGYMGQRDLILILIAIAALILIIVAVR